MFFLVLSELISRDKLASCMPKESAEKAFFTIFAQVIYAKRGAAGPKSPTELHYLCTV